MSDAFDPGSDIISQRGTRVDRTGTRAGVHDSGSLGDSGRSLWDRDSDRRISDVDVVDFPRIEGFERMTDSFPLLYESDDRRERIVIRVFDTMDTGTAYKIEQYVSAGPHARKTHAVNVGVRSLSDVPEVVSNLERDLP